MTGCSSLQRQSLLVVFILYWQERGTEYYGIRSEEYCIDRKEVLNTMVQEVKTYLRRL